jgi:hypothetical protein
MVVFDLAWRTHHGVESGLVLGRESLGFFRLREGLFGVMGERLESAESRWNTALPKVWRGGYTHLGKL